jgi:hypothetical protein
MVNIILYWHYVTISSTLSYPIALLISIAILLPVLMGLRQSVLP